MSTMSPAFRVDTTVSCSIPCGPSSRTRRPSAVTRATLPGGRVPLGIATMTGAPIALFDAGGSEPGLAAWLALGSPADGLAATGSDPEADAGGCDPHAAS